MSNNNHPHSHLSQPAQNPSWNPLQIPSYIPRQPQLAHMSNERPMVRSPLAWHASAQPPPEAIYNFMSANHKNLDHHHQMNPLLAPPYVSGTLPFDSMDLSVQSSRSAATPLNKTGLPPQQQNPQQQQHQQSHASNYPTIHNLTTNAPAGAQHTSQHLAALAAGQHAHASLLPPTNIPNTTTPTSTAAAISVASNKFMNANGSECESLLPPPPNITSSLPSGNSNHSNSGNNNNASTTYMQSNRDENFKLAQLKRSFDPEPKSVQKPVDLINKDCSYAPGISKVPAHNLQQHAVSNKKTSPLRSYHQQHSQQQQQSYNMKYNGPQTPPTPQSPIMQQPSTHTMQSPTAHGPPHAAALDYNQLHVHHNLHASGYVTQSHLAQGQGQLDAQHLHYPMHHSQHLAPAPIQQQTQPQSHHLPTAQYHAQQSTQPQSTQPVQQTQPAQQMHSRNTQLTNLDMLAKHKQLQPPEEEEEQTVITDLSTTASYRSNSSTLPPPAPAAAVIVGDNDKVHLPDAPESPYMTTSNEESLESNSNSGSSRKRRKRKSSQVMRVTPNDNATSINAEQIEPLKRQRTVSQGSNNSCSPKQSPKKAQKSPKNGNAEYSAFGLHSSSDKIDGNISQENGCLLNAASPKAAPVHETSALANTTDNSNSSTLYSDDKPKTKKQRQALLQRNLTEQHRRQHEDETQDLPTKAEAPAIATQEQTQQQQQLQQQQQQPMPPSPQSNSSSSTSSSSSGGSHSSHSSNAINAHKNHSTKATTDTPASPALVEQGNIDAKAAVSVHDDDDEEEELPKTAGKDSPAQPATVPTNRVDPCHFEEVEDKLEEMFAGIEDEPAEASKSGTTAPTASSRAQPTAAELTKHELNNSLPVEGNASPQENKGADTEIPALPPKQATPLEEINTTPTITTVAEVRPMATKAAMKSTIPSPIRSPTLETCSTSTPLQAAMDNKNLTGDLSPIGANRRMPRRLSVGMDPSLFRFMVDEPAKPKKTAAARKKPHEQQEIHSDDDKPSTSAAAAAALAARKLSEAAAAQAQPEAKPQPPKVQNKKKKPTTKGKKSNSSAASAKSSKSNAKNAKQKKQSVGRKPMSTDEDSTPAPTKEHNGTSVDLKLKSPYVLVKPDGSLTIKNNHTSEDVNEKQTKVKKAAHDRKKLRGMHSSTLSNRYDADTTDSTWICVFCKRGPHKVGLGDLFGPYLVSIDCEEYRAVLQSPNTLDTESLFVSKRKRSDMVQAHPGGLPVVPATLATIMQAPKITMHKRKRKQPYESSVNSCSDDQNESQSSSVDPFDCSYEAKFIENFRGMSKTSEQGYEIWLHEDCAVWANDIHLIGAHVQGLDAAVWDSIRYQCVQCAQPGANVCCFQRTCKAVAHVPCARSANWRLSEKDRKVFCEQHTPPTAPAALASTLPAASVATTASTTEASAAPFIVPDSVGNAAAPPLAFNINSLP